MEPLFTTALDFDGKTELFEITFSEEKYHFKSINSNKSFTLRREDDEWHTDQEIDKNLKNIATEKLEAYLLAQH